MKNIIQELESCASCEVAPGTSASQAWCDTKDCWLRSLMGAMSKALWNETMRDLALARVQQSASDMHHD